MMLACKSSETRVPGKDPPQSRGLRDDGMSYHEYQDTSRIVGHLIVGHRVLQRDFLIVSSTAL